MSDSQFSFPEIARSLGPVIDAALAARIPQCEGCPARLAEAMRYSLLSPGKRLRPVLTLLAAEACGGTIEPAIPAACAVEMVHAYSLIHDDLPAMDDDDLRRGRPTCHKAFDEATAILAGDGLLTLAFEILAREIQPPTVAAACCAALAHAAGPCNMVGGQADDISVSQIANYKSNNQLSASSATVSPSTDEDKLSFLKSIHRRKTGAMICVSLKLGALVSAASEEQLKALETYGQNLGLAFQIVDDLLDVRSSAEIVGKKVGKDAAQGKLTFPALLGLDQSTQHAEQLIFEARKALEPFGKRGQGLAALATYVLERDR